jgi:hypothetical protein
LLASLRLIASSNSEVLERAGQAPVRHRVGNRGPVVLKELRLNVDRRGAGLLVGHASPLQDVDGVLALVKEETLEPAFGGCAEEVVEGPRSFITNSRLSHPIFEGKPNAN